MVLIAWHWIQLCQTPSLPVAVGFTRSYSTPSRFLSLGRLVGYRGKPPRQA